MAHYQLHILGLDPTAVRKEKTEKFFASLPSPDTECLAAIAFVSQILRKDQWTLHTFRHEETQVISDEDVKTLPLLRHTSPGGRTDILTGFAAIVAHLSVLHDLDGRRNGAETAMMAHLLLHGPPLLDLSLYVSSDNYTALMRPLLSACLPFPLQYTVPPSRRAQARHRTRNHGLSALDLDHLDDDESSERGVTRRRRRQHQLQNPSLLIPDRFQRSPEVKLDKHLLGARHRLDALISIFCEPLEFYLERRTAAEKSAGSTLALEALILAYISLMISPATEALPQSWLQDAISKSYSTLYEFGRAGGSILSPQTLPWATPMAPSAQSFFRRLNTVVAEILPTPLSRLIMTGGKSVEMRSKPPSWPNHLMASVGFCAAIAFVYSQSARIGILTGQPGLRSVLVFKPRNQRDLGDAGRLLREAMNF